MVRRSQEARASLFCTLGMPEIGLINRSRMNREVHVRFWERLRGRFPRSTHHKLHWHLDVSFDEDQNRHRSGYAAENISLINKTALNLLKNETTVKAGIKTKRLKAGWDDNYMLKVLMVGLTVD